MNKKQDTNKLQGFLSLNFYAKSLSNLTFVNLTNITQKLSKPQLVFMHIAAELRSFDPS